MLYMIYIDEFLLYVEKCIAALGVLVIIGGSLRSLYQLFMLITQQTFSLSYIRWQFGETIVLGLEFIVGADIVGSLVKVDYYNLGLLAVLVIIRTVLSFFLTMEISSLSPQQQRELT